MSYEVKVPEVSEGVSEGIVVAINVAVDDTVEQDQALIELETDKAVVEIPSPQAGRVSEIRVSDGDTVKTGDVIAVLADAGDKEGETASAGEQPGKGGEAEPEEKEEKEEKEEDEKDEKDEKEPSRPETEEPPADEEEPGEADSEAAAGAGDEVDLTTARRGDQVAPAAPSVRRKARELGVDIYRVQGSGPGGRISREDIRRYVRRTMEQIGSGGTVAGAGKPLPDFSRWGAVSTEPLSKVRQVTAETMSQAWSTIPMVAQNGHARISAFESFRKEFNSQADPQTKLTMTALLVKICAAALRQFPQFNSSLDVANRQLILKDYVHIGVAVDTPAGLLVPVLQDADSKSIETVATELNELAAKARERKLKPEEMEGGCFTISNLGGIGRDSFTPIVYPPQVAILGVARGRHEPVWNGQDFLPELVLPLTLTYDHRVIDGADGARFLRWVCRGARVPAAAGDEGIG